jgi:hypothetical protein
MIYYYLTPDLLEALLIVPLKWRAIGNVIAPVSSSMSAAQLLEKAPFKRYERLQRKQKIPAHPLLQAVP